jgi:prepilin signal peptidase PulO-like enzyme (type II secretory pathway)
MLYPMQLTPDIALIVLFAVLGLAMGSFGNVVIFRVPEHRSLGGRSSCMTCHRTLNVWELIPVVSFLIQRARCRGCRSELSWQYPLVELLTAFLFVFALLQATYNPLHAVLLALALWLLLLIAIIDARTSLIPDALSFPLLPLGLLLQFIQGQVLFSGILLGAGFFAFQWIVSRGRWVGSGDIILGAGIGALLGSWQITAVFLFFSYVIGAAVASLLLLSGIKTFKDAIPFGPFLVFGTFLALAFGEAARGYVML